MRLLNYINYWNNRGELLLLTVLAFPFYLLWLMGMDS